MCVPPSLSLSFSPIPTCVRACVRACVCVCVCADGCAGAERPDGGGGAVHVHLSLSPGKNPPLQLQAVVAGFWGLLAWWCVAGSIGVVVGRLLAWWCVACWRGGVSLVGAVVCSWLAW